MTEKQKVNELEDIKQASNDQHIMVITDLAKNQLRKEKISDFINDTVSKDENNGIIKGTDEKLYVIDTTNAENISNGIIDLERLPDSGVKASTYPYPVNMKVNSKGQIVSVDAGEPGANNANTDLSNISSAGQKKFDSKADVDLNNTLPEKSFIEKSVGWALPDYSAAISISAFGSSNAYTAPTSGFISIQQSTRGIAAGQCKINGIIVLYFDNTNNGYVTTRSLLPIKKGDNLYWDVVTEGLGIGIEGWFIPANL